MSHNKSGVARHLLAIPNQPLVGLVALWLLLAAFAPQSSRADGPDPQDAQQLIVSISESMLSALDKEGDALRGNRKRVEELAEKHLLPHIDFSRMSRLVLGRYWRTATAQQRKDFVHEFRQFLIRFYTTSLLEYTKDNEIPKDVMHFLPLRASNTKRKVTVRSEVDQPGSAQPVPVNYKLFHTDNQWKVYDVVVDGVSLVVNYRSSFAGEIRRGGMDGLISRLAARNKEMTSR